MILCQQRADSLLRGEDGAVVGVKVGGEELRARAVVAADGVLSFIAQEAGLRPARVVTHFAVGFKEVIRLDPATIEARFNLPPGQGSSRLYLGQITGGLPGGGFLYTNRDSLSLGLVLQLDALQGWTAQAESWELLERFKERPDLAPLIAGGETVEYSAHLIPEGGFGALPPLGIPGLLLVGDAAGLVLNTGLMVRGMDLALASGALAGKAIVEAHAEGLGPLGCLARYSKAIAESFILKQLRAHRRAAAALARPRLYDRYPQGLVAAARELFEVGTDGATASPGRVFRRLRKKTLGWRGLMDLWRLLRT
jgi:electron transfer flavoprotein-quinone oxidoreductase